MSDVDVIETSEDGRTRVVLVQDVHAEQPDGDGMGHVYAVYPGESLPVVVLHEEHGSEAPAIVEALERWGTDWDTLERYLRMVHGAVSIAWYDRRGGGRFLNVVTRQMAQDWGNTGDLSQLANLTEWEAWDEGDVWIAQTEQLTTWARMSGEDVHCRHCGRSTTLDAGRWVDPVASGDDLVWRETCDAHDTFTAEHEPDTRQTWEYLESVGGLYGSAYAMERARELLREGI